MPFQMPDANTKADYVKKNFGIIAGRYDIFNDFNSLLMHRRWKNAVIAQIRRFGDLKKMRCLDLCTGTGDIALRLARAGADVTALDFCDEMLAIAEKRLAPYPHAITVTGDATDLSRFPDGSFNAVTVGFGLRNVTDLDGTLRGIFRVLNDGGIFISLDVGRVRSRFIRIFADFYFFRIVPLMGYVLWRGRNEMFDYLPQSSVSYPSQQEIAAILERRGFFRVRITEYVFGNAVMHVAEKPGSSAAKTVS